MINLATKLKNLLELRQMSQADLHRVSGVSRSHISEMLSGKRPSVTSDTIAKLSKALRVTPSYFMQEDIVTPFDLLPEVPKELKEFMIKEESMPYLQISKKAKESGVTPEMLEGLLNTLIQGMNTLKKKR